MAPPETELALIRTELGTLQQRLEAGLQLALRLGLGPQTASAERSWHNATAFFDRHEWLSATRELNNFLNQTQVPEPKSYLRSQYMLGRSYEELGYKAKSLRAYFRYLATYLTSKVQDHSEVVDVLRRMLPLAAAQESTRGELNQLLASMTTIELPKAAEPEVLYYAAKAAANSGQSGVAGAWLDRASETTEDPALRAKALYVRALLAISRQDFEGAEEILATVIQTDKSGEARDLARLALARLSVHQKRRETALKYYALVPEASSAFKEATFESLYVHLDLKQDSEARAKAMLYTARWPDGPEALQVRMLLAYLDMRAGDLTSAGKSIAAADGRLRDINDWIVKKLSGKSQINQGTLADLMILTGNQLPIAPSAALAAQLFARLAEAERRLTDLRGDLRNTLFTIGRGNIEHLRPAWANRAEQLGQLGDDLLNVGHRLAGTERHLYLDALSAVDRQKLEASEARRVRLLGPAAAARRKAQAVTGAAAPLQTTRQIAAAYDKLRLAQAQLASARYLEQSSQTVKPSESRDQALESLAHRTDVLAEKVAATLGKLRAQQVENMLAASPHRAVTKFFAQYAGALRDESEILARARDDGKSTTQRLNADDAALAWRQWEFLAGEVFRQLGGLDQEIGSGLHALLDNLDEQDADVRTLEARVAALTADLEGRLGQSLGYLAQQYLNAINLRFSRHQKWRADIDWLTYQSRLGDDRKLTDRLNLEQQILKDNLTDLQQGVLWQWPK